MRTPSQPDDFSAGDSEKRLFALLGACLLSIVVHAVLLWSLRDCTLTRVSPACASSRRWTRDVPPMMLSTRPGDPLATESDAKGRPMAAPDVSRPEDKAKPVETEDAARTMAALDASVPAPSAAPAEMTVEALTPRQDVLAVKIPEAPDASLPKPTPLAPAPRVPDAPDVVLPAVADLSSVASAAKRVASVDKASAASALDDTAAPPPVVLPTDGIGGTDTRDPFGFGRAALTKPDAAVGDAAAKAKADGRESSDASSAAPKAPEPVMAIAAPQIAKPVNEDVVRAEQAAVRALRESVAENAPSFEDAVETSFSVFADASHPSLKYFHIRIAPRPSHPLPVIPKDVLFLLDVSPSVKSVQGICKRAIVQAIRGLNPKDRFNVVVFNQNFKYLFDRWMPREESVVKIAESRLDATPTSGWTDVFKSLRSILTVPREASRPVVALVVTDGEATSGVTKSTEIVTAFADLNEGLISVYMAGVKPDANAYLMDLLARGNRGGWSRPQSRMFSDYAAPIGVLARQFANPVLSDVTVSFTASSRSDVYPRLVTNLCLEEPIDIYGVCPSYQKELIFTVRGLNGRTPYETLFRRSFARAKFGTESIKREWAQRRLYAYLAAYAARPSASLLRDIRIYSRSYQVEIPYEDTLKK